MSETQNSFPLIISPSDVAEQLDALNENPDICIVDLSGEGNYLAGHIPGAIYLPYQVLMLGQPPAPGKLPPKERLLGLFQQLGLTANTHFFVCDDEGGGWAGRFIWTLDVVGHNKYSYIDGGMLAWKAESLPLQQGPNSTALTPSALNDITIDRGPIIDLEEIIEGLDSSAFTVWDARSPQEYDGSKVVAAKGGHIPGAINAEWTSLMDPQRGYKIRSDAKEYLEKLGIDGSTPIITHCQSHHRSGFTYIVGKALGYDIRAYDGSWSEWGNHPSTPVEV